MNTTEDLPPRRRFQLGPGLLVAATGVGAGDLIAAAVAGQRYGLAVLWAVLVGAGCKWVLNEGVARWQLATGESLIAGWSRNLPKWVSWYFGGYLTIWSFVIGGALGSACGVAAKALWPSAPVSVAGWAVIHALGGYLLVRWGRYAVFEKLMQSLIAIMFVVVVACGIGLQPDWSLFLKGVTIPQVPTGSLWFVLGLIGGVGGSVTLLCYGYWLREKKWSGPEAHSQVRWDLGIAYGLTAIFGLAVVVIAAGVSPADSSGSALVVGLGERLGELFGSVGRTAFLVGFWCAVFSSMLGVWQGIPHLFADWWIHLKGSSKTEGEGALSSTAPYRYFLLFLTVPPLLLQLFDKPILIVVIYAIVGAFFMPFLATTLLILNNRRTLVGALTNTPVINLGLILSLLVFGLLFAVEIVGWF